MEDTIKTLTRKKKRHGCLTAWLIYLIVFNTASAISYFIMKDKLFQTSPTNQISDTMLYLLILIALANVFFAVLLLKWKKIGFWGFLVVSIVASFVNFSIGSVIAQSLIGVLGIIIIFVLLLIKKEGVSAWKHLN